VGNGLVLASPASESPPLLLLELVPPLLLPLAELLELLPLDPHAATAITKAIAAARVSVSRNGRIFSVLLLVIYVRHILRARFLASTTGLRIQRIL
jgi:hypothetical protein